MYKQPNKQPPSTIYFIINSKNFVTVSISSNIFFLYAITINLGIYHTALHELYRHIATIATCQLATFSTFKYVQE